MNLYLLSQSSCQGDVVTNKRTVGRVYGSVFNGLTGLGRIDGADDLDLECSDADFQLYSKMEHLCNFRLYGALNRLMYSL